MKPIGTNNLNAWGYAGLFILFCIPGLGTTLVILFALFGQGEVRSLARGFLLFGVLLVILEEVLIFVAFQYFPEYLPDLLPEDGGMELFRNLPGLLG